MSTNKSKGIYFALIAALVSGVSIFVNKFAVTAIKDPLIFTTVKNTGVALVILILLLTKAKFNKIKNLNKHQLVFLALVGIIGGSIPFYLFFTGLSMIPAINGAIIQKTLVLWVAVFAAPYLGEKLSNKSWLMVFLLFGANLLVGGFKGFNYSRGEIYVLAATIFWAIEIILAKKILPKVDPDILIGARMGIGAIILIVLSLWLKPQALMGILTIDATKWMWVILTTGLLLLYVSSWYRALKFAPATVGSAILVASTLVTNLLSAIFITHTFNQLLIIQSLLISVGIFVLYKIESMPSEKSRSVKHV